MTPQEAKRAVLRRNIVCDKLDRNIRGSAVRLALVNDSEDVPFYEIGFKDTKANAMYFAKVEEVDYDRQDT